MLRKVIFACFVSNLFTLALWSQETEKKETMLFSFESEDEIKTFKTTSATISRVKDHATDGAYALKIDFAPGQWPNAGVVYSQKQDWSANRALSFDIHNPNSEDIPFNVRIDDSATADGSRGTVTMSGIVRAGGTQTFLVPMKGSNPREMGMRVDAKVSGYQVMRSKSGAIDWSHIYRFQIFRSRPTEACTLFWDNVKLLRESSAIDDRYQKIVDTYGQYTKEEWLGKIHSDEDLMKSREEERNDIASNPAPDDRDEYGGWSAGPKLEASGFFRTAKHDGRWWLVTPTGHLFFSVGVDSIRAQDGTYVEGREFMFTGLPETGSPLGKFYGKSNSHTENSYGKSRKFDQGKYYDFYKANLYRKYGEKYVDAWADLVEPRLLSWGFNTIANWSDPRLFKKKIPYVANLSYGDKFAKVSSGNDHWGPMPDPFDEQFALALAENFQKTCAEYKKDPLLIGYFVSNELSWGNAITDKEHYGLAVNGLLLPGSAPTKKAYIKFLEAKYGSIEKLNGVWETKFTSWDEMREQPVQVKFPYDEKVKEDLSGLLTLFAEKYFEVVSTSLKKIDSEHLYLGCRFAWRTPEAVAAAAKYCDVVSFNIYSRKLGGGDSQTSAAKNKEWDDFHELNKPAIIGEFHFGSTDRGMFAPGLVEVPSEAARGTAYRDYVKSVAENPDFVGCHWFQYVDQPLTGRMHDGENYHIGILSITDTPYPEFVAGLRDTHRQIYQWLSAK